MTPVFLYGTLRYAPLLSLVLGREAELIPATLADHQVVWAAGESYPLIRKGGDRLHGALIEATEDDLARMDFYEGAFAYELVAAEVQTDAGVRTAQVYWPPETGVQPGDPWHLEDWAAKWGDLTLLAAAEVMAAFGQEDPLAVGRRFGIIRARAQAALNTRAWQRPRTVGRAMGQAAAELVDRRPEYLGFFTLETLSVRHDRLGDGPPMAVDRLVFRAGEAVTVLPYDPVRDRVLLVEQFRAAPFAQGDPEPWLLEPIAGIVDAGETVEEAARREAGEEAGITLDRMAFVARYYPSPGATAQIIHSYVATADLPDDLARSGGLTEEGEDIAVHLLSFAHLMEMCRSGELANAPAILTAQWLDREREALRAASA